MARFLKTGRTAEQSKADAKKVRPLATISLTGLTLVLGRGVSHLAGHRFISWNQFISQSAWNPRRDICQKLAWRDRFTLYPRRPKPKLAV